MSVAGRGVVSVLIVHRNTGDDLRRCLGNVATLARAFEGSPAESAMGEEQPRIEAIVVDNASDDGSTEVARECVEQMRPTFSLRLIRSKRNLGFGAGCNLAAAEASGRFLLLLNPDAAIGDRSLSRLLSVLQADSRLAAAAPLLVYPDGAPQIGWSPPTGVVGEIVQKLRRRFESSPGNHTRLPRLLASVLGQGWFTAACLLVRRRAFEAVGGFDEGFFLYFEDADLGARLTRAGWRQALVRQASAVHVRGASTSDAAAGPARLAHPAERTLRPELECAYRASQLRYYDRHRPVWEQRLLRRRLRRKFLAVADREQRGKLLLLLQRD